MTSTRNLAAIVVLSTLVSACVSTSGREVDADTFNGFVEGKTTKAQLVSQLGEPTGTSSGTTDETVSYDFTRTDNKMMIPIIGPFLGIDIKVKNCIFIFDAKSHVLKNKNCGENKKSLSV